MKHIIIPAVLLILLVGFIGLGALFPRPSSLEVDGNGMIHHPWYGEYPQRVAFEEGMTLHPGQIAEQKPLEAEAPMTTFLHRTVFTAPKTIIKGLKGCVCGKPIPPGLWQGTYTCDCDDGAVIRGKFIVGTDGTLTVLGSDGLSELSRTAWGTFERAYASEGIENDPPWGLGCGDGNQSGLK